MTAALTTSLIAPLTARPGFSRALAAVRGAEIGLLRAVALDVVAIGGGDAAGGGAAPRDGGALSVLGPDAIEVMRRTTGPASVELQAHATPDGAAVTFLGRADRGIAVSAHLSIVTGERADHLRATIRIIGTHGSVLVDLLRPVLDVRTAAGTRQVAYGARPADAGPQAAPDDVTNTLAAIAESARSGHSISTSW